MKKAEGRAVALRVGRWLGLRTTAHQSSSSASLSSSPSSSSPSSSSSSSSSSCSSPTDLERVRAGSVRVGVSVDVGMRDDVAPAVPLRVRFRDAVLVAVVAEVAVVDEVFRIGNGARAVWLHLLAAPC